VIFGNILNKEVKKMYLSRLFTLFSMYTKKNIISYSTIKTNMKLFGEPRMRIERTYDIDKNVFFYSHIKDYKIDSDINDSQKIIITNKLDWYLANRKVYNVRYIPYYITKIKNQKVEKLENIVNKTNISMIYECNISTKLNEWNNLFFNKNIDLLQKNLGEIYIVPSNGYQAVRANYKKELIPYNIKLINISQIVSCQSSITLSIPENNLFTLLPSIAYYLNYDINYWYWFLDEEMNSVLKPCVDLLELPIINLEQNLCKVVIPSNEKYLNKIFAYQRLSFQYLNDYENDRFEKLNTKQECVEYIKQDVMRLC
jgi:hypothetical protein